MYMDRRPQATAVLLLCSIATQGFKKATMHTTGCLIVCCLSFLAPRSIARGGIFLYVVQSPRCTAYGLSDGLIHKLLKMIVVADSA